MARERNAYDILGIARDAAPSAVRTQYRAHMRRYRPEAAVDNLLQDAHARNLINAFLLLTEGDRTAYDQQLRHTARGEAPPLPNLVDGRTGADRDLLLAELALIRKQYADAASHAGKAREAASRDARAYVMLGDIAHEQQKYDTALTMYNFAVQFDPDNQRYWQLLNETTELKAGHRVEADDEEAGPPTVWQQPVHLTFIFVGILAVTGLSALLIRQNPGRVLFFGITDTMMMVGSAVGLVIGFLCGASGLWENFNDQLVYQYVLGARERGGDVLAVPVGVVLLLPALLSPWLAMVVYLVIGILDEHFSPSIIMALAFPMLVSILIAMMFPEVLWGCLIVSGTFVFLGISVGWLLGSLV